MTARALWTTAPGRAELRPAALRAPTEGEVLVRTLFSGLSRGTERLVLEGRVPQSEHARIRAPLQEGDFPFPVKYGYAVVGRDQHGTRVFCLHPHQARFGIPAALCTPIPDAVPDHRAVLARFTVPAGRD